jgi:flagellar biosynthesis anti-sigma factor FlgM
MEIRNSAESLKNLLGVNPASSPSTPQVRPGGKPQSSGITSDSATVSNLGQEVSQAATNGDVRWEKVSSIQAALNGGTYNVPASAVASKVVDALLPNKPGSTS